jgi:hypothetical protein
MKPKMKMTNQHPITPPPELVEQWHSNSPLDRGSTVATLAAQWGADQELEACCEWLNGGSKIDYDTAALLRAHRRPKLQSLKEQALDVLEDLSNGIETADSWFLIQSALEQLDD